MISGIAPTQLDTSPLGKSINGTGTENKQDIQGAQDRFLKLLVAQLNNQDPMNPMDNAQMTTQIAQINTVTGIQQVNETLKGLSGQFTSFQVLQGSNMVGRNVLLEGNQLTRVEGVAGGAIDLAGRAESVKVDIVTAGGQVVESLDLGPQDAGRINFSWDGKDYKGRSEPSFRVTATLGGRAIEAKPLVQDRVLSVGSDNGSLSVQLLGRSPVGYDQIKAIL